MQGSTHPGAVTPTGVRDGDPAALEALCARRGAAVLAFCHEVCEPEYVHRAAAEAFARFRAAVVVLDNFTGIDPDELLLGATRHAAAALARSATGPPRLRGLRARGHSEACSFIPEMLVARAGGSLSEADAERLDEHLARCAGCREVEAAFARAEHAYRTPGDATVPRSAARAIVAALAAAAPVRAPAEHHEPDAATTELEAVPAEPAVEYLPEPEYEEELEYYDETEAEPAAPPPVYEEEPEPAYQEPEPAYQEPEPAYQEPEPVYDEPEPAYQEPEPPEVPATVGAPPASLEPVSTALPRQRRRPHVHWPGHMPHVEPDRMRDVALPAAVVIVALICAMGIAGVFGGPEPAPPTGSATAAEPVFPVGSAGAPARETAAGAAAEIARQARREQRRAERLRAERLRRARRSASPSADNAAPSPGADSPAQAQPPSTTRTPPAPGRSNRDDAGRLDAGRTGQGVGVTPADQEPDAPLDPGSYESGTGGAAPPG